jgi:hypothetical protein
MRSFWGMLFNAVFSGLNAYSAALHYPDLWGYLFAAGAAICGICAIMLAGICVALPFRVNQ